MGLVLNECGIHGCHKSAIGTFPIRAKLLGHVLVADLTLCMDHIKEFIEYQTSGEVYDETTDSMMTTHKVANS